MKPLIESDRFVRVGAPLLIGALLLGVWEYACRHWAVPVYLFPKPSDIYGSLAKDWYPLLGALYVTMKVTFQAFFFAVLLGTLIAFMFVQSRFIEISFFPYAVLLQVTPIVAIAPLIIILVKNTQVALTVCATLVALFPMISNTTIGLRSVDQGLQNLFRMNKANRTATLLRLRIPSALPYFFAGLRISSGLALIGAVVAEFVAGTGGRSSGLAYEILQAGFQLDIPRMFAALLLIAVAGILMFVLMAGLSKLALGGWHESEITAET
ncbi:MAG: putative transporter, permease protein [Hyphomicrobiales bacterium]|nr:putative transporter, permease protein [Hyphomicrobiales bacterium]